MSFWLLDDATVWESQVLKGSSPGAGLYQERQEMVVPLG